MHLLRTRFKKEIVCEFLPPRRKSNRVIIFLGGMPGYPSQKTLLDAFSKKGFWVFLPRFRGSWESRGVLFKNSPVKDISDIISSFAGGFYDLWTGTKYRVKPQEVTVVGSSFGGAGAILSILDPRVKKAIAISPVADWRSRSKSEPIGKLSKFVKNAFGEGYRIQPTGWRKLKKGRFYNPSFYTHAIDGSRLMIMHAKDDDIVAWRSVEKLAKNTGATLILLKKGGHLGLSQLLKNRFQKRVSSFLKNKKNRSRNA